MGCTDGTTVIVEDLFFNVPARRKFLKRDSTEATAVGAVVEKIAISKPGISIKYISDGTIKFMTSGNGDLKQTIYSVFGRETASRALEVSRSADGVIVTGFVSEPDLFKSNRNMENIFVNGRYVKSRTAMAAVEQAYKSKIPSDKFPFCVLNITVTPSAVDVNVHPAKLEVKFSNEKIIFDSVYYAVLSALEAKVIRPELKINPAHDAKSSAAQSYNKNASREYIPEKGGESSQRDPSSFWIDSKQARKLLGAFVPADSAPVKSEQMKISKNMSQDLHENGDFEADRFSSDSADNFPAAPEQNPNTAADDKTDSHYGTSGVKTQNESDFGDTGSVKTSADPHEKAEDNTPPEYIILGEAYNCYVILQLEDRLLFVDKHAAHERILFDELCKNARKSVKNAQILLAPLEFEITAAEADAISDYENEIKALGFEYTEKASASLVTISIMQIPEILNANEACELFKSLASKLSDATASVESASAEFFEARLFQSACKAAIKGGRIYNTKHIKWICDRLIVNPGKEGSVIRTCPHGRPVAFEIKKSSIDRQFGRIM